MRENELLQSIAARSAGLSREFADLVVGPGDDCAVVRAASGQTLLLKVDQVVEGRHFTSATPLDLVARKAIARAVSDIAAMGGTPRFLLAGAVLPRGWSQQRAEELCAALFFHAREFGCAIVGGDTATHATESAPLTLSISGVGSVHTARGPVLRSGARTGDDLYVTGRIGGSFLAQASAEFPFPGGGRHLTFMPRVREASWLCESLGPDLHAMMDISDGLGIDASRLAEASGVRIEIDEGLVPLSAGIIDAVRAMSDGEDYELLLCVRGGVSMPAAVPGVQTPITRIGRIVNGAGSVLLRRNGSILDTSAMGWEHR